ncbi:MAG TPA: hypothetical protein VFS26_10965 [Solirubrobacterales bacterium]|nr:hypothetical protein [Solirubrobacterales bacterium]
MEATETIQMPALGEAGDPCGECGAPLAADQRYCLNCGRRRTGPRVDYRTYLAPGAPGQAPPPTIEGPAAGPEAASPEPEPAKQERDFAPLAAVGGIALLGLMLLVGVLIGKGGGDAASPAPQVIRVGGAGETASTAANPTDGGSGAGTSSSKSRGGKKEKAGSGAGTKAVSGGLTGDAARETKGTVEASKDDLEALENSSGEDYEDTVKKLPDKIATPGAAPPIDKSKAPGGGGGGVTIE